MPKITFLVLLATYTLVGSFACAVTASMILVDGQIEEANLISLSLNQNFGFQAEFRTPTGVIRIDTNQLVRWGNPNSPSKRESVCLQDGSKIFTGEVWTTKECITIDEGKVNLHRSNGELSFSYDSVKQLNLHSDPEDKIDNDSMPTIPGGIVHLNSGDQISGQIVKLNSTELLCRVQGEQLTLSTDEINFIELATKDLQAFGNTPHCLIGLEDGSIIHASNVRATKSGFQITMICGETGLFQSQEIIYLQPMTGSVTYLSDLKPIDYRHTPYLSLKWPYGNDQLPHGEPLVSNDLHYKKGISLHSASRIVYPTRKSDQRFQTTIALSDSSKKIKSLASRSVDVQILAIQNKERVPLVETSLVGTNPEAIAIDKDISNARAVVIVVDYGEGADVGDDVLFLDARFVNNLP